ncbi:MAG: DMT family transporter [Candidatus Dormibacteria bacterium]
MGLSVGLALLAAVCLGIAAVAQQKAAAAQRPARVLSPLLVWHLLGDRTWLAGVGVMIVGYASQAAALGEGRLTVVEPLLSSYLIVALITAAIWTRQRARWRDWVAAALTSGGVAVFLVETRTSPGRQLAPGSNWAVLLVGLTLVLVVAGWWGQRLAGPTRAVLLAVAGGIALGCSDALTKQVIGVAGAEHLAALGNWAPYCLVLVGAVSFLVQQSAYHAGRLAAALPALSVLEPTVGTLIGITLFQERAASSGALGDTVLALSVAAMVTGVVRLARSPLVTGKMIQRAPLDTPTLA